MTRNELAMHFTGMGVELGVAAGDYSECILSGGNVDKLYSIDAWAGDRNHDIHEYLKVLSRMRQFGIFSTVIRARFDEAVRLFADDELDFIYIDGYAHTGQEGGKTLEQWWPKVKKGGLFCGHDYHSHWPLTVTAVDNFARKHNNTIMLTDGDRYPSWVIRK